MPIGMRLAVRRFEQILEPRDLDAVGAGLDVVPGTEGMAGRVRGQ
jgi:hypothetical protein